MSLTLSRSDCTWLIVFTPFGLRAALFFTRAHARLYRPSITQFSAKAPPHHSRLALQFQKLENTIHTYVQEAKLAA